MDNTRLVIWKIVGVFVIFIISAIWHFGYKFLPYKIFAPLFPVNESVWEHVKLFFFPALIFYIIEYSYIGENYNNYIFAHAISLLLMPIIMITLYYGYRYVLGIDESLVIDIIITFVTIALGSFIAYKITVSESDFNRPLLGIIIIIAIFLVETYFTFYPPQLPIFYDKTQDAYGILPEYEYN